MPDSHDGAIPLRLGVIEQKTRAMRSDVDDLKREQSEMTRQMIHIKWILAAVGAATAGREFGAAIFSFLL